MTIPTVDIIFGGQYGSESKRLFNEFYYKKTKPDAIISNFGPNSGGYVSDGSKWAVFAMGAPCIHMLSPGSIIDLNRFKEEVKRLPEGAEVYVHENACIVLPDHLDTERDLISIGSTMTGTAAAVIQKMMRDPDCKNNIAKNYLSDYTVDSREWMMLMAHCKHIQVSVPQGHSLSINYGMYPYCTSRNCSPQQALADASIPTHLVRKVIACMRTFPIRVANRYDEDGNMVGYSGPAYADQKEITWEKIGVKPEITSVSKKVRRVFTFSVQQYMESCIMNGVTDVFLNFMNYLDKEETDRLLALLQEGPPISWLGYGPRTTDIASVTIMKPGDEIDGRIGCYPTIIDLQVGDK